MGTQAREKRASLVITYKSACSLSLAQKNKDDSAATMAGNSESLNSSSYPNKRLKTLIIPEPDPNQESSKLMEESYSVCCGICLLEEGRSIRGQIDSCNHYFCFVCIIEWSRIESTCPMCKQRFTTIRRPPKEGVLSSERIVNVPKRDQVTVFFFVFVFYVNFSALICII